MTFLSVLVPDPDDREGFVAGPVGAPRLGRFGFERADGQPVFAPVDRVGVRFVELLADDALAGAPREETGENATEESEGGRPHGAAPFREITIESSLVAMSYCTPVAGVRCLTSTRYSSGAISMNERIVRPASAENVSPHER